jgi:hypothetical protein
MFNAVYINFSKCYGPEGSLPLRQALEALVRVDEVETYRSDGFVLIHCPVKGEHVIAHDGDAVALGPDGSVLVLEDIEPFRQEVSKAMTYIKALYPTLPTDYDRFIIPAPKPDPLVEVLADTFGASLVNVEDFRAALEARGLEIREKGQ